MMTLTSLISSVFGKLLATEYSFEPKTWWIEVDVDFPGGSFFPSTKYSKVTSFSFGSESRKIKYYHQSFPSIYFLSCLPDIPL